MQIHPAGDQIHTFQGHGAVGVLGEAYGEQHAVLGMGGADGLDLAQTLVGHGVAHGVQANGLVIGIGVGVQQSHGLHHVGVAADDHIHAHIAQLLCQGGLLGAGGQLILVAPVHKHHGGFRTGFLHESQLLFQIGIEGGKVIHIEGVDQAYGICGGRNAVDIGTAVLVSSGVGIGNHTDIDVIDVLNDETAFIGGGAGTQSAHIVTPQGFQSALQTHSAGIVAVVIDRGKGIKTCGLGGGGDLIGAVEAGITGVLIAVVGTAESGLQVGNGIVRLGNIGGDVAEHAFKVVAAVSLLAGAYHGHMHQHVAGGHQGGGVYHMNHRGLGGDRFCFGGQRIGFIGFRGIMQGGLGRG